MFSKLRSLIFKLEPELAHSLAIKALKFGYIPPFKQKNNELLKTNIFGKNITNLIGMAAGFDKDAEVYNSLFKLGYGFVEVGTVTPLKQYGNPKPRMFRLEEDKALINRLGFNNSGSEEIILNELDTISIPPGVCRSFKNISNEEGLLQVIISGGIHDMNDIAFTKVAKDQMEKIESNLSKKFEDVGFKFNAGLNN